MHNKTLNLQYPALVLLPASQAAFYWLSLIGLALIHGLKEQLYNISRGENLVGNPEKSSPLTPQAHTDEKKSTAPQTCNKGHVSIQLVCIKNVLLGIY